MTEYISLDKLNPNRSARIAEVRGDGSMVQRLEDLGIIPGTEVSCVMKSPLGDPAAYLVRGAVIAIRREDSSKISAVVSSESEDTMRPCGNRARR